MTDIHGDSPTKPRHTRSAEYRSVYVSDSWATLTLDIPEVSEVYLDSLMDAVLPNIPSADLTKVYDKLVLSGCINSSDSETPRWSCLERNPSDSEEAEGECFKFLETIAQSVARYSELLKPHAELKVEGDIAPQGHCRNLSRPDGFFVRAGCALAHEKVKWSNVIMPMEFKKDNNLESRLDDFAKVMWSMHHTMRNDACRRYVHGFTCEDTKARLWYADRSDIVVSDEFDVNNDWKYLVRIILSMLVAQPAQLGYDEDMKVVDSNANSEPSYDIIVRNSDTGEATVYRTVRIISDVGADSMVSRGTRVWKVRKLVDGVLEGPEYALKDVWVYEGRFPEHLIIRKIREEQPDYSQYFLTPINYGYVPVDPATPLTPDNTHRILGHPRNFKPTGSTLRIRIDAVTATPTTTERWSVKTKSVSRDGAGRSEYVQGSSQQGFHASGYISEHARLHYRFVSEEIGEAVHDLRKFRQVFLAIRGGWQGLHAIHLCRYVHRDVSSGNVLLVPPSPKRNWPERGVIMDLEYSKEIDHKAPPYGVRIGTVAFMATEVALMKHDRLATLRASRVIPLKEVGKNPVTASIPFPPFRHNPLHDMESIWWLCLWMLFYLVPSSRPRGKDQPKHFHEVFYRILVKRNVIADPTTFKSYTKHLDYTSNELLEEINKWRDSLNMYYNISYQEQISSAGPLGIQPEIIEASYELGREHLNSLIEASKALPDCETLSEKMSREDLPTQGAPRMKARQVRASIVMHADRAGKPW